MVINVSINVRNVENSDARPSLLLNFGYQLPFSSKRNYYAPIVTKMDYKVASAFVKHMCM